MNNSLAKEEQNKELEIINDVNTPDDIRIGLIEKRYQLDKNVSVLKEDLYFDIVQKYHELRMNYSLAKKTLGFQLFEVSTELEKANNRIAVLHKILRDTIKEAYPESAKKYRNVIFNELLSKYGLVTNNKKEEPPEDNEPEGQSEVEGE